MERCVPCSNENLLGQGPIIFRVQLNDVHLRSSNYRVLKALKHMHELGAYHGDIKIGVYYWISSGVVKLFAFGTGTSRSRKHAEKWTVGNMQWSTTEVLKFYLSQDFAATLFSLCVGRLEHWNAHDGTER